MFEDYVDAVMNQADPEEVAALLVEQALAEVMGRPVEDEGAAEADDRYEDDSDLEGGFGSEG